ncbi:MAG TPA: hypothetical protein VF765_27175 [Polyangiaceae bacterium]
MRARKKALAASFVVTFASGCDSKPSQPPAAPTVDVGPSPSPAAATASASAAPADSTASGSPSGSTAVAALPPAPPGGRVEQNPDGTCTWFPDRHVNRPGPGKVILNPPPPHAVQCPPPSSDGGT